MKSQKKTHGENGGHEEGKEDDITLEQVVCCALLRIRG